MSICTDAEILEFLGISNQYFTVNAAANVLKLAYDGGATTSVTLTDGTYEGSDLASELSSKMDSTLGCTSTVSFSSSTYKFTIAVSAGHTIAYVHSGSSAAQLFGLNQDHSAALSFTSDISVGSPTSVALSIKDAAEDYVQRYCGKTFDTTSYTLEAYDGKGTQNLFLKNYPIITLTRLAIGRTEVISIYNSTTHTSISVSVTDTGITLSRDGSTDATLAFADYTTMSTMVAAINAVGSNWSASILSSLYDSFLSSSLLPIYGQSTIDSNYVYLEMPYEDAEDDFKVFENQGRIYREAGFPKGTKNIFVTYSAGYSSVPEGLKLAVKVITQNIYSKWQGNYWGLTAYQTGDVMEKFGNTEKTGFLTPEIKSLLSMYRRIKV